MTHTELFEAARELVNRKISTNATVFVCADLVQYRGNRVCCTWNINVQAEGMTMIHFDAATAEEAWLRLQGEIAKQRGDEGEIKAAALDAASYPA